MESMSTAATAACEDKQLVVRRENVQAAARGCRSHEEFYRIHLESQKPKRPTQAGHAPKYARADRSGPQTHVTYGTWKTIDIDKLSGSIILES